MAVVDITIDQNDDTTITIADAAAAADDRLLFQFFENGNNVLNLATENLGGVAGDIVIDPGVDYSILVSEETALKLATADLTYKFYKTPVAVAPTLSQNGDVTNTPLTGSTPATVVNWANGNNITETTGVQTELVLDGYDDIIFLNPNTGVEVEVTLPDATTMVGKRFKFILTGVGDASIIVPEGLAELVALVTAGDSAEVISRGADDADDWKVFGPYIQS